MRARSKYSRAGNVPGDDRPEWAVLFLQTVLLVCGIGAFVYYRDQLAEWLSNSNVPDTGGGVERVERPAHRPAPTPARPSQINTRKRTARIARPSMPAEGPVVSIRYAVQQAQSDRVEGIESLPPQPSPEFLAERDSFPLRFAQSHGDNAQLEQRLRTARMERARVQSDIWRAKAEKSRLESLISHRQEELSATLPAPKRGVPPRVHGEYIAIKTDTIRELEAQLFEAMTAIDSAISDIKRLDSEIREIADVIVAANTK